jgi:hypothetical protein
VRNAKLISAAIANCPEHRARDMLTTQRTHKRTQRHVDRIAALMLRSRAVGRMPQMRRRPLPPCTRSRTTAPLQLRKRNRQLLSPHRHLTQII